MNGKLRIQAMRLLVPFLDDGHVLRVQSFHGDAPRLLVGVRERNPKIEKGIREAISPMRCHVEIALG